MLAPFVEASELAELGSGGADLALCDVRWYLDGRSGRDAYLAGHLPGAIFVDLDTALAGPPSPEGGRHPLPGADEFAMALSLLGIDERTAVVAYDDDGGVVAARLVWMLRAIGADAAVLNGGITAWDGPLETTPRTRKEVVRPVREFPAELLATIEDACDPSQLVIDARPAARYRGEVDGVDAHPGHIPGAYSLPCREHLGPDQRLRPDDELRARIESLGIGARTEVVSYCGSGVTACHNLLVLERLGYRRGRLFPGSWSQYAADESRPTATGPNP